MTDDIGLLQYFSGHHHIRPSQLCSKTAQLGTQPAVGPVRNVFGTLENRHRRCERLSDLTP